MMMLFDDDYILKTYIESEKREAAEKAAKKAAEEATKKGDAKCRSESGPKFLQIRELYSRYSQSP